MRSAADDVDQFWRSTGAGLVGEAMLPSVGSYETGARAGRMNKAIAVPLRAVSLPAPSGQFELAAFMSEDM